MDYRIEFALKALRTDNFRALCVEYGISAKTGYKWRARLLRRGLEGLAEESRRPHQHPEQLSAEVICEMVRLKRLHCKRRLKSAAGGARKVLHLPGKEDWFFGFSSSC